METNKTLHGRLEQERAQRKERIMNEKAEMAKPYLHLVPLIFQMNQKVVDGGGSRDVLLLADEQSEDYRNTLQLGWSRKTKTLVLRRIEFYWERGGWEEVGLFEQSNYIEPGWYKSSNSEIVVVQSGKETDLGCILARFAEFGGKTRGEAALVRIEEVKNLLEEGLNKIK